MIGDGNAVIAWAAPTDSGFAFEAIGENRREPVDFDGLTLVRFKPAAPEAPSQRGAKTSR
jgi:CRISPR-associated protein Cas2